MDRIVVTVCENDKLEHLIHNNSESIKKIVLADTIESGQAKGFIKECCEILHGLGYEIEGDE